MRESWRNSDGSINYEDYMTSPEWRRFREGYWRRNPHQKCSRCGMGNEEHRDKFGTRLHLNHMDYRTLGCEADAELEPICKECHDREHSGDSAVETLMALVEVHAVKKNPPHFSYLGLPETDWEPKALELIVQRRTNLRTYFNKEQESEEMWRQLARLSFIEDFVRACIDLKGAKA